VTRQMATAPVRAIVVTTTTMLLTATLMGACTFGKGPIGYYYVRNDGATAVAANDGSAGIWVAVPAGMTMPMAGQMSPSTNAAGLALYDATCAEFARLPVQGGTRLVIVDSEGGVADMEGQRDELPQPEPLEGALRMSCREVFQGAWSVNHSSSDVRVRIGSGPDVFERLVKAREPAGWLDEGSSPDPRSYVMFDETCAVLADGELPPGVWGLRILHDGTLLLDDELPPPSTRTHGFEVVRDGACP
jgi:hypothetical protein